MFHKNDGESKNSIRIIILNKGRNNEAVTEKDSQVYTWVKKYAADGEAGLVYRRGHHKTDEEVDDVERLRRKNLCLRRQL